MLFITYQVYHSRAHRHALRSALDEAERHRDTREIKKPSFKYDQKLIPPDPNEFNPKPGQIFKTRQRPNSPIDEFRVESVKSGPSVEVAEQRFLGPPCSITHKDALSAISRAKSDSCKIEIAEVACKHQKDHEVLNKGKERLNAVEQAKLDEPLNPKLAMHGFPYKTMEEFVTSLSPQLLPVRTGYKCPVEKGTFKPVWSNDNFKNKPYRQIDVKQVNFQASDISNRPTTSICYLLILHGRSLRQVTRLIRTIYTSHDYYILHVDSRSEYLYHSLRRLLDPLKFKNVVFQRNRFTPIWGGVSLLVTIKDAIAQALKAFDRGGEPAWDYLINLSFADFPIDHRERLRAFLSQNEGKTFCKAHGREHDKFIRKQGLNKLFYECENRMWRLGERDVPFNLQLDGGSDWFALHKSLCQYSVSNVKDDVLEHINLWFNYTLLPAESYFHTLLKTSERCYDLIDNNLRVTNWNRARGCKCQYKAIVDWCGCSPNDFTAYDIQKVFNQKRPVFFARKFEEMVSQVPINTVHMRVFGDGDSDLAFNSYWESVWEREFDNDNDYKKHVYGLFAKYLDIDFTSVKSVHAYKKEDVFTGYILITDTSPPKEYFLRRKSRLAKILTERARLSGNIREVDVGSNWDVKELIFRDWGGIVTTSNKPHISVLWNQVTEAYKVVCMVIDPNGRLVTTADLTTAKGTTVITADEIKLALPLQIGRYQLWFTRLREEEEISKMYWKYDASASFVVLPGMKDVDNHATELKEQANLVKGRRYNLGWVENELQKNGHLKPDEIKKQTYSTNELINVAWEKVDSCTQTSREDARLPDSCRSKYWSTQFPDKKSHIYERGEDVQQLRRKYLHSMLD